MCNHPRNWDCEECDERAIGDILPIETTDADLDFRRESERLKEIAGPIMIGMGIPARLLKGKPDAR